MGSHVVSSCLIIAGHLTAAPMSGHQKMLMGTRSGSVGWVLLFIVVATGTHTVCRQPNQLIWPCASEMQAGFLRHSRHNRAFCQAMFAEYTYIANIGSGALKAFCIPASDCIWPGQERLFVLRRSELLQNLQWWPSSSSERMISAARL